MLIARDRSSRFPLTFSLSTSSELRTAFAFGKLVVDQKAVDFADSILRDISSRLLFPRRLAQSCVTSAAALICEKMRDVVATSRF